MNKPLHHPIKGDMSDKELFDTWLARLGYNKRQVTLAGERIGLEPGLVTRIRNGSRPLSATEKLAMSAVRAGLSEWSPDYDDTCSTLALLRETVINK